MPPSASTSASAASSRSSDAVRVTSSPSRAAAGSGAGGGIGRRCAGLASGCTLGVVGATRELGTQILRGKIFFTLFCERTRAYYLNGAYTGF